MSLSAPPIISHIGISRHFRGRNEYRSWDTWCLHLFDYYGELRINQQVFPIRPGFVSVTPVNLSFTHVWFADNSRHITVHFQPPALETGIELFPTMKDLGTDFDEFWSDMVGAISWFSTNKRRSEARLWDVLFRLAVPPTDKRTGENRMHPALQAALQKIEVGLSGPISITNLAGDVGLSHNHLIRLFRQGHGMTIGEYIRGRRSERALHLLMNTTMPIKTIAAEVGVPDVQQFNKMMRKMTAKSPSAIRRG